MLFKGFKRSAYKEYLISCLRIKNKLLVNFNISLCKSNNKSKNLIIGIKIKFVPQRLSSKILDITQGI